MTYFTKFSWKLHTDPPPSSLWFCRYESLTRSPPSARSLVKLDWNDLINTPVANIPCILISFQATRITGNGTADSVDGVEPDVISHGYFWASLVVWFVLPLPMAICWPWTDDTLGTPCGKMRLDQYCSDTDDVCCLFLPLYYLTKFLRPYINAVFVIYIWIPGMDIYWGVQNLFCHEKYNREQNLSTGYTSRTIFGTS